MKDSTVSEWGLPWITEQKSGWLECTHLCIAWSLDEAERIGEVAAVERPRLLGRGEADADDTLPRLELREDRPGESRRTGPLRSSRISRRQLELRPAADGSIEVTRTGRCPLLINGREVDSGSVSPGDVLSLKNSMVLFVTRRRAPMPALVHAKAPDFALGRPDSHGLVGESAALWRLRDDIAYAARSKSHVLLLGGSGSGKELVARALHAESERSNGPFVARNAATFPEGLVDAELFGNIKGYPNPGTPERPGLFGEARGGTLFLDEIGELPPPLQSHLLRVLDRDGEYQRLGDARMLRADVRLIAATNRPVTELKHDFAARFTQRVTLAPLSERREDIPLLVSHLLERAAAEQEDVARRFFQSRAGRRAEPRIQPELVEALLRHPFDLGVRELERVLRVSLSSSREAFVALTPEVLETLAQGAAVEPLPETDAKELTRAEVEDAMVRAGRNVTRAAELLGLKNRYVLYRLMKKLGLDPAPD